MNLLDLARAALPQATVASNVDPVRQWRVRYPKGETLTVLFAPAVTQTEVADLYRDAAIEPALEAANLPATGKQVAALRELIETVLAGCPEEDRVEALMVACSDPRAALTLLRLLSDDQRQTAKWLGGGHV
jgi:hypothetical protein